MYAIALLQGMVFYAPVATLYRQVHGLSMFQITLIESISLVLCILLEVPWGALADRVGYKRTMVFCCCLYFVSKLVFWQADGFGWFLAERVMLSVVIAGLSGAAIALHGGFAGINGGEWIKVLYGLVLSTLLGFAFGWAAARLVEFLCKNMDRRRTTGFFGGAQIAGGAAMAFMHGAQDGQKFMGVFMLGIFLANGQDNVTNFQIPLWLMVLCSAVMALGTSIGGYRIIKAVGMDMVKLEKYQGFAADMAGAACLLLSSLTGIPVSTTHTKTTAIMGVGAARRLSSVNWGVVKEMGLTWALTFPGCGAIGFLMARLFMWLF